MPKPDANRQPIPCDHKIVKNWETGEYVCEKCGLIFDDEEKFE